MELVQSWRSQNGRWGAEVYSNTFYDSNPAQGTIRSLGSAGEFDTFVLEQDSTAETWVLFAGETNAISGATIAWEMSLQGNSYASILVLGPVAIVKSYGYKRRSSSYILYKRGVAQGLTGSHLLALGLIEPSEEPTPVADPPPIEGAMAAALHRAGLA